MEKLREEKEQLGKAWQKVFKSGTDFDTWGQPVEAVAEYEK